MKEYNICKQIEASCLFINAMKIFNQIKKNVGDILC